MSNKVINLTADNFFDYVNRDEKPILVDFYADWCGPCKMQAPIVDEVAEELSDKVVVAKANTDNCYEICVRYGIASIPTLLLFKGGELLEKSVGLTSKAEISNMIIKHI